MKFAEKTVILKDGRKCLLRPATPDDAQEMIDYLKLTATETPFLLRYPDEITFTLEKEREILGETLENERDLMMLGIVDGVVTGNCGVHPLGWKRRIKHRSSFGIALKKQFWGLGIGTAMMEYAMELAKQIGYEQVELEVIEGNDTARHLYEKNGFVETGKTPNALKYDDGTYRAEFRMLKIL